MQARERRAPNGRFKSNISLGGRGVKFGMPPAMTDLAVRVAKTLDIAGVDFLFGRDGYRGRLRSLCREFVGRGRAMPGQSQTRKAA